MPYSAEERIKVTHILTDSNIGGAGRLLVYQLQKADRDKFEYSVILPEGAALIPELEATGVTVETVAGIADRSNAPVSKAALVTLLKKLKPDIVHTHSSRTGRFAAVEAGVPVITLSKHCSDMPSEKLGKFPYKQLSAREWKKTLTGAIATDDSAADALVAENLPREKIKVIYNGAPSLRVSTDEEKARLRAKLGIPDGALVVGIFARIEPVKDVDTFLFAAHECRERGLDGIHFLIAGDGSRRWYVDDYVEEEELGDNVHICGFVSDIAPLMNICDVNVNCSVGTETSNLALIEGMSLGVVPVVSDLEPNVRLVGESGIVFEREDSDELADIIEDLLCDREKLTKLSASAKARYEAHYTSERFAREVESYYLQLFSQNNQN
ncbi:MAG: glycosyltransferase [Eubacteriales bacterium]